MFNVKVLNGIDDTFGLNNNNSFGVKTIGNYPALLLAVKNCF